MAVYLLNVTEKYRVDTIEEALKMRDEAQSSMDYELQSFGYVTKVDKKFDEEYQNEYILNISEIFYYLCDFL